EAQTIGPSVKRSNFARFPSGRVVVLADPSSGVTILPEDFRNSARALRNDAGVAVVARCRLGYDACSCNVMVAACEQGGPCRRTQRRCMEPIVAQSLRRELLHVRRGNSTAEYAELAEADVVEQDEHDIGRALGRTHNLRESGGIGVLVGAADLPLEVEVGPRQRQRAAGEW